MDIYEFVRGPLAWVSLTLFFAGSAYQILSFLSMKKEKGTNSPLKNLPLACQSLLRWAVPYSTVTMRKNRLITLFSFFFHLCLIFTTIFLLSHSVLWYESWKITWCSIPESAGDLSAIFILLSCLFFLLRRLVIPEVRQVTSLSDYLLLVSVIMPVLTGFLAYHQWGPYRPLLILHILSGEILLITIPFSRLSHMLVYAFSRADMGTDYGHVLSSNEW